MIDLAHGRRRFHNAADPNNASAYRPFALDLNVSYWRRFVFPGEPDHTSDDDGSSTRKAAALAVQNDGKGAAPLYWKVVTSGEIAEATSVGEGDNGDVTLRVRCKGKKTGGMTPLQRKVFKRSEVEPSTREAAELATNDGRKAPGEATGPSGVFVA